MALRDWQKVILVCVLIVAALVALSAVTPRGASALSLARGVEEVQETLDEWAVWMGLREPGWQGCHVYSESRAVQTIRSQIELYRIHNDGVYPDFTGVLKGTFGDPAAATPELQGLRAIYYMRSDPINRQTQTSSIAFGTKPTKAVITGDPGWIWDGAQLWINGYDTVQRDWIVDPE